MKTRSDVTSLIVIISSVTGLPSPPEKAAKSKIDGFHMHAGRDYAYIRPINPRLGALIAMGNEDNNGRVMERKWLDGCAKGVFATA